MRRRMGRGYKLFAQPKSEQYLHRSLSDLVRFMKLARAMRQYANARITFTLICSTKNQQKNEVSKCRLYLWSKVPDGAGTVWWMVSGGGARYGSTRGCLHAPAVTRRLVALHLLEITCKIMHFYSQHGPDQRWLLWTGLWGEDLGSTSGLELCARTLLVGAFSLTNGVPGPEL